LRLRDRFIYRPRRDIEGTPAEIDVAHEDVDLVANDGVRLHAWWMPREKAKFTFLWFHGNAGNVGHRLGEIAQLSALGVSLLLVSYRGYGRSGGRPSEQGLYRDADAGLAWLEEEQGLPRSGIVLYGRSLGAAVATDLAVRSPGFAGLVLLTPFTSMRDVAPRVIRIPGVRWLAGRGLDLLGKIPDVTCPILIVQGGADEMTPPEMGHRIHAAARAEKTLHVVPGGGHMSTHVEGEGGGFGSALLAYLSGLIRPSSRRRK
jgi:uncharacterized protein